jgi:hypothetical protein
MGQLAIPEGAIVYIDNSIVQAIVFIHKQSRIEHTRRTIQ